MDMLIPIAAFTGAFSLVIGVGALLRPRVAGRRLARLRGDGGEAPEESLLRGEQEGVVLRVLRRLGSSATGPERLGPLRQRMIHAGYRSRSAPAVYYGLRLALAVAIPTALLALPALWSIPKLQLVILLCLTSGAGFVGPGMWLDLRRSRRQTEVRRVLPDALDLMVVCVEAGYGINASLARVADELCAKSPVLSTEFSLVNAEIRAGKSLTDALRGLTERTGVEDLSSLVALLVQTERFGTSLANALRVHADAMRVRRMQRAEERAQKAPLKLILPSTMIFVGLMLIFLAPSIFRFMQAFPD